MEARNFEELNITRMRYALKEFIDMIRPELMERYKSLRLTDLSNNRTISFEDIDFNQSLIFISDIPILPYVSIYGLQKINKVLIPDPTSDGSYSRIKTNYGVVESNEIRYSKLDLSSVQMEEVPEMYKPSSFLNKELCIWKFGVDVGQGDNKAMYRFCNERLDERYNRNQLDWIFFVGTLEQFRQTYNTQLPILKIYANSGTVVDSTSDDSAVEESNSGSKVL